MVYQITISGPDGMEPSGKPNMKRGNGLPRVGFGRSALSPGRGWSKSVSHEDACTNARKSGKSVTLGKVRNREK